MGSVVATAGLFFGGAGAGMAAAWLVAPGSDVAQIVGFLVLPLAFVTGMQLWIGAAVVTLVSRMVRSGARGASGGAQVRAIPPGHAVFVATGVAWGVLAGVMIGLVPSAGCFLGTTMAFAGLGLGYGLLTRALVRRGLVPFPAES